MDPTMEAVCNAKAEGISRTHCPITGRCNKVKQIAAIGTGTSLRSSRSACGGVQDI